MMLYRLLLAAIWLVVIPVLADEISPVVKEKAAICMACHGIDGNSSNPKYPSLAGQKSTYLYLQLKDFMQGRRSDPEMSTMAATITDKAEALELAKYFSSLPAFQRDTRAPDAFQPAADKISVGKALYEKTICAMCHGDAFTGMGDVPRVKGQQPLYVMKQLKDFRDGKRTNDGGSMKGALGPLTDEEIESLMHFIAAQ
ncbi:MAG: c-type cytochrome [Methylophilales bacterium]|nr:c-type cytochrome [Methylophilales bacterium]